MKGDTWSRVLISGERPPCTHNTFPSMTAAMLSLGLGLGRGIRARARARVRVRVRVKVRRVVVPRHASQ